MPTPEEIKKQVLETSVIVENTLKSVAAQIGDIFQDALSEADGITKIFGKDVQKQLNSLARSTDKMVENQIKIKQGQASSKDIAKQLLEYEIKREVLEKRISNLMAEQPELAAQLASQLADVDAANADYVEGLKEQEKELIRIENRMGVLGKLVKGLNKIPIIGNLIDADKVETEMKKAAANAKSPLVAGFKEIGKSIGKSLTDPLTILTFFLNAGLKADRQIADLAKSLGIGKDQANGLRQNFVKYAGAAGDAFVTTDKLMEAQSELTNELGIAVQYSGKQAEDFSRLTKLMGLSASEAGKLARLSVVNGTSIEATTKSIIKGSAASQRANKIAIDQRTVLKEVSNLSAGILVKFQGNPEALGAAVVQAKALGLTLEEVDKISESLLNFETSIENELKAELITSKQINLERARAAALTGDQAALMQEIGSQVGTLEDFQNMNVIAQKSLAEAFGLSREEVSKMLIEQEKVNKLGDISKMTLDQQLEALKAQGEPLDSVLYKQIQQQSAQEKFNNAITKLQDLIGNLVAGPFGTFIDMLSNAASSGFALKAAIVAIGSLSLARTIGSLVTMAATLATSAVAGTTLASALTLGLGAVAIIAGVTSVLSMMNSASDEATTNTQQVKDGIAPSSKGPFTITDSFGATAITANGDNLAVSPNINRGGDGNSNSVVAAIEKLSSRVEALMSRPSVAYINGKDAFSKEVNTTSVQNTYKFA